MLEFPKIENPNEIKSTDTKSFEEIEKKREEKDKLPYTIKGRFQKNPDGSSIDIKTKYGTLNIPKDDIPNNLRNREAGEIEIPLTDIDIIAKEMLNQLLKIENKDE
ncbi:hypothetical protein KAS41_04210 [Candidatus Parcubacteria bacterium]|nr:hypothetical protein [Candidatus Parcubacteria bacterium]